ncbi:DUF2231 domain-containing protein [Rhodanobacter geophilus]|uniref:DUF2231 domain-containing protein n=1 Tax=Rhodanobacter geophilus TaxID=3162488 RepID=A0ABV3QLM7_9GAMM
MRHPLHPALVHFPVACWSLGTAADLAGLHWGAPAWRPGGLLLAAGTLAALPAMLAGFYELTRLADDSPATRDVYRHLSVALAATALYATALLLRWRGGALSAPDALGITLDLAGFAALVATGWLGGHLVYGHRLGGEAAAAPPSTPRE